MVNPISRHAIQGSIGPMAGASNVGTEVVAPDAVVSQQDDNAVDDGSLSMQLKMQLLNARTRLQSAFRDIVGGAKRNQPEQTAAAEDDDSTPTSPLAQALTQLRQGSGPTHTSEDWVNGRFRGFLQSLRDDDSYRWQRAANDG